MHSNNNISPLKPDDYKALSELLFETPSPVKKSQLSGSILGLFDKRERDPLTPRVNQITEVLRELFKQGYAQLKPVNAGSKLDSPEASKLANVSNNISGTVLMDIATARPDQKLAVNFWLQVAKNCYDTGDLNSAMAVFSGINTRFTNMKSLPEQTVELFNELKEELESLQKASDYFLDNYEDYAANKKSILLFNGYKGAYVIYSDKLVENTKEINQLLPQSVAKPDLIAKLSGAFRSDMKINKYITTLKQIEHIPQKNRTSKHDAKYNKLQLKLSSMFSRTLNEFDIHLADKDIIRLLFLMNIRTITENTLMIIRESINRQIAAINKPKDFEGVQENAAVNACFQQFTRVPAVDELYNQLDSSKFETKIQRFPELIKELRKFMQKSVNTDQLSQAEEYLLYLEMTTSLSSKEQMQSYIDSCYKLIDILQSGSDKKIDKEMEKHLDILRYELAATAIAYLELRQPAQPVAQRSL